MTKYYVSASEEAFNKLSGKDYVFRDWIELNCVIDDRKVFLLEPGKEIDLIRKTNLPEGTVKIEMKDLL